ncbi:MAG: DUF192 domain-containing protein [Candidatus Uhrbacteria bacterium]|nr:DUF192 domain-containing protein [Candidatus Uhrbacteria bacterium]
MIKPVFLFLIGTLAVVAILVIYRKNYSHVLKNLRIETVEVNGKPLTIEMVSTRTAIRQGLSDRDSMPLDHGMLFKMGETRRHTFWMKGMRFPLDIIWINQGTIVDIATLPASKLGQILARHQSIEPADKVLELNAGQAEAYGLRVGSITNLPEFR